jgi:hypothetical protein
MNIDIVNNVYSKLEDVSVGHVSMRNFSRNWLGKDPSYVGHKRAIGEDVSHGAILTMLGRMVGARVSAEESLATNTEDDRELMYILAHKVQVYRGLEHYIQVAIYEYAAKEAGVIL